MWKLWQVPSDDPFAVRLHKYSWITALLFADPYHLHTRALVSVDTKWVIGPDHVISNLSYTGAPMLTLMVSVLKGFARYMKTYPPHPARPFWA